MYTEIYKIIAPSTTTTTTTKYKSVNKNILPHYTKSSSSGEHGLGVARKWEELLKF